MNTSVFFFLIVGIFVLHLPRPSHASYNSSNSYWYILTPAVTNFTNYTTGAAAAMMMSLPLRARTGAVIQANETVAAITTSLTIIGDLSGVNGAEITIETNQSPIFVVSASGELLVRDVQLYFNNTLFNTQQNGLLRLQNVIMWMGGIGVSVQNNPGPGVGLVATNFQCFNLGTCLLYLTTGASMNCTNCRFANARNTAVSVSSSTPSALIGLNILFSTWVNMQFFITVQSSPNAIPVQYILANNWGYINNNMILRSFTENCASPSPSPTPLPFGGGGGSGSGSGTCPVCEKCTNNTYGSPTIWNIFLLILVGLGAVGIAVISLNSATESDTTEVHLINKNQ